MKVLIYTGFLRRIFLKNRLKEMKFLWKKDKNYWQRHIDDSKKDELKKVRKFCRRKFLRYEFVDDSMERSTNYHSNFFKNRKGIFGSNIYVCAYCGRFLKKSKVCVDHIIPVYKAKTDDFYRKLLSFRHIKNVNDVRNLAPSCNKCNSKKSANGGFWIIRGWFGRSAVRVILKEIVFLILGSVLLYYMYCFLRENSDYSLLHKFCDLFC